MRFYFSVFRPRPVGSYIMNDRFPELSSLTVGNCDSQLMPECVIRERPSSTHCRHSGMNFSFSKPAICEV
jgi:hypothetical protein